jgi:hypothetical protein
MHSSGFYYIVVLLIPFPKYIYKQYTSGFWLRYAPLHCSHHLFRFINMQNVSLRALLPPLQLRRFSLYTIHRAEWQLLQRVRGAVTSRFIVREEEQ